MRTDEQLAVGDYLKQTIRTPDGIAWLFTCIGSLICIADILIGTSLIPLRETLKPDKAISLLIFSPLLIFVVLVRLRQMPFGSNLISTWIRSGLCLIVFLILNF